jgi:signal transducing adaptor molecule
MLREPQGKEYGSDLSLPEPPFSLVLILLFPIDYKFQSADDPPAHDDDEARRREEEELQRVLELSMQDRGGRKNWNEYSLASSSGAGGSSAPAASAQASTARQPSAAPSSSSSSAAATAAAAISQQHARSTGYVPSAETHSQTHTAPAQTAAPTPTTVESSPQQSTATVPDSPTSSTDVQTVTRVRALHSFEPTEPNELAFDKGDIIKVVNREYKDWWRGQLKGRTGIFPVNYVVRVFLRPNAYSLMIFPDAHVLVVSCTGTSSGTHPSRTGSRGSAGSYRVFAGGQC